MIRHFVVLVAAALAGCAGSGNSAGTGATVTGQTCDAGTFEKSYRQIRDDHQKSWDRMMGAYFSDKRTMCPALKEQISKLDRYIKYRQDNFHCMNDGRNEILQTDIGQQNRGISRYQEKCG